MSAPSGKFYLAGPMSGIPQFNFPAFDFAAKWLRAKGWDIVSPAELDEAETRKAAEDSTDGNPYDARRKWGWYLGRDVEIVADQCDGIVFLGGWEKSRGARLEAFTAYTTFKKFYNFFTPVEEYECSGFKRPNILVMDREDVACGLLDYLMEP